MRTVDTVLAVKVLVRMLFVIIIFIIFAHQLPKDSQTMDKLFCIMLVASSILLLVFIYRYMSNSVPYLSIGWDTATAGKVGRNQLSYYLALVVPIAIWKYFNGRLLSIWSVPAIIHLFALVYTMSRGAWLSFIIGLLSTGFLISIKKRKTNMASGMGGAGKRFFLKLAAFTICLVFSASFMGGNKLASTIEKALTRRLVSMVLVKDPKESSSILERLRQLQKGKEIFLNHPVSGIGTANFPFYSVESQKTTPLYDMAAHNDYIGILSEQGIIGLSIFLLMLFQVVKKVVCLDFKTWKHIALAHSCSSGIVFLCFIDGSYLITTYIIFGMLFALDKTRPSPHTIPETK